LRANTLSSSRIGVIVSKKNAPRAVDRNRIKRLVREAFRQNRQRFAGNDLVVLARRCPPRDGWGAARAELAALFVQLATQLGQRGG
jgi:ribonuclease P protein component